MSEKPATYKDGSGPIKDSGQRREYTTGAVRDRHAGKGRMDLLPPTALLELAKHFEDGAAKYDERNWEKGIPMSDFMDSALRHWCAYMQGKTDENHLRAFAWNAVCALATDIDRPEMQNIPARLGAERCG